MESFLLSAGAVALAEIGDKTMLLSFVLAARFRAPAPIVLGILLATLANHLAAAALGQLAADALAGEWLRWLVGGSFVAVGAWALAPDRATEGAVPVARWGALAATTVAFFLAEIGDKTQIATALLAAKYQAVAIVALGTTLGMLLVNAPAVLVGAALADRLPMRPIRLGAAALFVALGVATAPGLLA